MKTVITSHREDYVKKKRKQKIRRYIFVGISLLLLALIFSYVLYRPGVRINEIALSGHLLVSPKEAQEKTLAYLSGSYMYLAPKNSILLYPKKDLEAYLKKTFPRIETVSVKRSGLQALAIDITERGFVALWCGDEPKSEEACFFMDSNAIIFAEAPRFSGDAYTVYYGPLHTDQPIGSQFMTPALFTSVQKVVSGIKSLSLFPRAVVMKGEEQYKVFLHGGAYIFVHTTDDPAVVEKNLGLLVKNFSAQDIERLEYIDLRFGNKLFYKFKTASTVTTTDKVQDKTE